MKKNKKICFFFNHERGISLLKFFLKKKKYEVSRVFISKKNLHKKVLPSINKLRLDFKIISNIRSKHILKFVKKNQIDLNIISGFPYIFEKKLLDAPKYGTLNLHGGPLPKYKGASTLNWQIINGEKQIGISIIKANSKIDGGKILKQYFFKLKKDYDISDVHKKVNKEFPLLLNQVLEKLFKNEIKMKVNKGGKIYKQRSFEDGKIYWNKMSSNQVFNFVRAITKPYPGAYSFIANTAKRVLIFKCKLSNLNPNILPGKVFRRKDKFFVKCKNRSVQILKSTRKLNEDYFLN